MDSLMRQVMDLVSQGPVTPDEVAKKVGVSWTTANSHLSRLAAEGKIRYTKKGRVNVFYSTTEGELSFAVPPWVTTKELEELAEELEEFFPEDLSAAEMAEGERRGY